MERLEIRISVEEKRAAEAKAAQLGVSLTQLVRDSLSGTPLRDYSFEKKYMALVLKMTAEINRVGKNINQVQKKINEISLNYIFPEDEVSELNRLIREYMETRETLSLQIEKIVL